MLDNLRLKDTLKTNRKSHEDDRKRPLKETTIQNNFEDGDNVFLDNEFYTFPGEGKAIDRKFTQNDFDNYIEVCEQGHRKLEHQKANGIKLHDNFTDCEIRLTVSFAIENKVNPPSAAKINNPTLVNNNGSM